MTTTLKIAISALGALYLLALALYLIGAFGLFDVEPGTLSGVFLVILGLPWSRLIDILPEPAWPWLLALCPLPNIALLWLLLRFSRR